jgi:hypothetical protein
MPIVIPALEEGAHDVIWLVFPEPDNHSVDDEFRRTGTSGQADRFTLLVGGWADWRSTDVEPLAGSQDLEGRVLATDAFVTTSSTELVSWYQETVLAGERLDYYVYTGYDERAPSGGEGDNVFGLLVFLDYRLIPLTVGDDRLVRCFSLAPGSGGARIEANLVAPDEEGPHELCAMRVNNPSHTADELMQEPATFPLRLVPGACRRTLIRVR